MLFALPVFSAEPSKVEKTGSHAGAATLSNALSEQAIVIIDDVHAGISEQLVKTSNRIDDFFSNKRMDEESSKSKVVFSSSAQYDVFLGGSNKYSVRAQLHFPKTQRRLRLLVDNRDDKNEGIDENDINKAATENVSSDLQAALQYILLKSKYWQINANAGVRFSIPLDPFAKFRVRRLFSVGSYTLRLTQSVFHFESEGWGQTSVFDVEKRLNETYFFRSSRRVNMVKGTGEKSFLQTWSIFQEMGKKKIMSYTLGANADLNAPATMKLYYLNARFRHNFYKKWAFYEIVSTLSFDRRNRFNASPGLSMNLDIVFG